MFIVLLIIFLMILGSFSFKRYHLLLNLLSLEFAMLLLFIILQISVGLMNSDTYLGLYFLLLGVCEGVLGLGLVVGLSRSHGYDYFSVKNLLVC